MATIAAAVSLGVVLAGGPATTGYAADGVPPDLPSGGDHCVAASPVRFTGVPWPVARMAAGRAWPLSRGAGVTVAIVDSGVSRSAPALAGAVRQGRDVVSGGPANSDCLGRGTALAGIVAARPATGTGVAGIAPAASILPIRIVGKNGRVPPDALATGIRTATSLGADIILVGTGGPDSTALRAAVSAAAAADVVVVAAVDDRPAGPADAPPGVWYPAAYDEVIAVAGVSRDGRPSQAGDPAAGVDLLAPDVDAMAGGPTGAGHYRIGGSAAAAAGVAGTAALLRGYRPRLTGAQVRERLELTAEHPPGAARSVAAGAGTIDPYAALAAVDPAQATQEVTRPREGVVLPVQPAPDPVVARARLLGGAIAGFTVVILAALAVVRSRRRRLRGAGSA